MRHSVLRSMLFVAVLSACNAPGPTTTPPDAANEDATAAPPASTGMPVDMTPSGPITPSGPDAPSGPSGEMTPTCLAGYAVAGTGCTWAGVIVDHAFSGTTAAWAITGPTGVSGLSLASGASFGSDALCANFARLSQAIVLPDPSQADRLALSVTVSAACGGVACTNPTGVSVEVDGKRFALDAPALDGTTYHVCLSDVGGATTLAFQPNVGVCSALDPRITITSVDIAPDAACPAPGTVRDGDFALGGTGWTLFARWDNGDAASATVAPTGPFDGSACAHLHVDHRCSTLKATTRISLPSAPGMALSLDMQLAAGNDIQLLVDNTFLSSTVSTGAPQHLKVCLPSALSGWAHDFSLLAGLGGSCLDFDPFDLFLDNFALESSPDCAADPGLLDPGAEASPLDDPNAWHFQHNTNDTASLTQAPSELHSGAQAIKLTMANACGYAAAGTPIVLPVPGPSGGPAISVWVNNDSAIPGVLALDLASMTMGLPPTSGWEQQIICLPPERAGLLDYMSIEINQDAPDCNVASPVVMLIDDLQTTTSDTCPSL